jgi:hypothetical protein
LAIGYLAAIVVLRVNGLGLSGKDLSPSQMVTQIQTTLAIQVIYFILINTIKVSILFFYLRIGKALFPYKLTYKEAHHPRSRRQATRIPEQNHHRLSRYVLLHLRNMQRDTM